MSEATETKKQKTRVKLDAFLMQLLDHNEWHVVCPVRDVADAKAHVRKHQLQGTFKVVYHSPTFTAALQTKQIMKLG